MERDTVVYDAHAIYQRGKQNDRIYIIKLLNPDAESTIKRLETLAAQNGYGKIIGKIPAEAVRIFENRGYISEAVIPKFYNGKSDCCFMAKYLFEERKLVVNRGAISAVLDMAASKKIAAFDSGPFTVSRLTEAHCREIAKIYNDIFESYPFPIDDPDYIQKTMTEHIVYYGAFSNGKLVACGSAETDLEIQSAEMTDFAVLPEWRGQNAALLILKSMEKEMKRSGFKTLYTIARSISYGMNCTFGANGYRFAGTLYNNTQISGAIESMNVWYKRV